MKFLSYGKDGGYESTVSGYWLVEIKSLFSVVLLKFENGSRDAYHDHAFNCISWVLKGKLVEHHKNRLVSDKHRPGLKPIITKRSTFHKVISLGNTWVLSFRGPWSASWREYIPSKESSTAGKYITLTNGRVEVKDD